MTENTENDGNTDDGQTPDSSDYVSDRRFADFPISAEVLKGVLDLGYETATPVQAATIEAGIAGKDMLVRAKTGTGKTTAFCLPMIERIGSGESGPRVLILAPTRELAQQIAEEAAGLAKYTDIEMVTLVGGLPMGPQEKALAAGAQFVVGTPGRVLDHIRRGNFDTSAIQSMCLDEADEMLSMGFFEDVTAIIDRTPADRQILLFSATISDDTKRLVDTYLKDAENIRLSTDADNVELIEHILYETDAAVHKVRSLLFLLDTEDPTSAIIFCNTREDTATVASFLDRQGLDVQLLSGELSQARRSQVMKKVKSGDVRYLVATDVAARGIDISDLSHVINYSLPSDPRIYLHRSGRTGRIGKEGKCINLVGGADLACRKQLETVHNIDFNVKLLPDTETASRTRVDRQSEQIRAAMGTMVFESYLPTVRALKERPDGDALLAATLRAFFLWNRQRKAAESGLDSLADLRERRNEKADRKAAKRDGGRRSGGRDGGRGRGRDRDLDRDDRRGRGRDDRAPADDIGNLDDLLSASDSKSKPKKKRSKKSRGSKSSAPAAKSKSTDFDDLDSLLS